jgi:hypothetical protein
MAEANMRLVRASNTAYNDSAAHPEQLIQATKFLKGSCLARHRSRLAQPGDCDTKKQKSAGGRC